jgi:hypothetical protein
MYDAMYFDIYVGNVLRRLNKRFDRGRTRVDDYE